jgi:hypothetical protein
LSKKTDSIFPKENEIPKEYKLQEEIIQRDYLINGEIHKWEGQLLDVYSPVCTRSDDGTLKQIKVGSYPMLSKEEALKAALATKETEHVSALEAKDSELAALLAVKETHHITALEEKEKELKLKDEEHAACNAALLLKDEELQIIKERVTEYQTSMLIHQRAGEAAKVARLGMETKLADAEKMKVWLVLCH